MTRPTLIFLSRRALQLTTFFLTVAPFAFGGEPVTSFPKCQLIGHIVVTARRPAPASVAVADLGAMTVTERRETALARKDTPQDEQHSL